MALEFFHIRENDTEMVEQLIELEKEMNADRAAELSEFEICAFIKYARVYVAVQYDELLGSVIFVRDFDHAGKVFLYSVNIRQNTEHKDLGASLIYTALSDLKEGGVRSVEVLVDAANFKALQIYREKLGFNIISDSDEDDEKEGLLTLRKVL